MVLGCLMSFSALQAAEPPAAALNVRERLAFTWTSRAKRLDFGNQVIYYQGNATRNADSDSVPRVTLTGDILVIEGGSVVAASEVSLPEDGKGKISVKGPSKLVMGSADPFVQQRIKELTAKR